jgi:hypothetical protein
MEDDATPKPSSLSVIPEVYYDLISRVPPGVLVVASLYLLYVPRSSRINVEAITASGAALVLAGLLGSGYAVGLLISSLGDNIRQMHRRNDWDVVSKKYSHLCPAMIRRSALPLRNYPKWMPRN